MKVYFYNNIFPSEVYPNIAAYSKILFELIKAAGYDVVNRAYVKKRAGKLGYVMFMLRLLFKKLPGKNDVLYINHYTHLLPLVLKLYFVKRRVIYHWHGEELASNSMTAKILRTIARPSLMKQAIHISPSNYYCTVIRDRLKVPDSMIMVSPSGGVDMNLFKERITPADDQICIGFPAALCEHKGIKYLYALIERNSKLESKIGKPVVYKAIDYGNEADAFKDYVRSKGLRNVRICQRYVHHELPSFYEDVHLTLFLSKRESLGLTVLESMASGVPVLARRISSMPEMVLPEVSGELVSEEPSTDEIMDCIEKMIKQRGVYQPRQVVEMNYSQSRIVEQYERLFNKILEVC